MAPIFTRLFQVLFHKKDFFSRSTYSGKEGARPVSLFPFLFVFNVEIKSQENAVSQSHSMTAQPRLYQHAPLSLSFSPSPAHSLSHVLFHSGLSSLSISHAHLTLSLSLLSLILVSHLLFLFSLFLSCSYHT